jgi:DNA-binding NarL/FixJ family response regulator
MVDRVYTASSLEEFEIYRSVTDILCLSPGNESITNFEEMIDDSSLIGVLILVSEGNERSSLIPDSVNIAWGILPLEAPIEQFEAAVRAIAVGLSIGKPSAITFLIDEEAIDLDDPLVDPLTDRELEVLQLLAQGKANKQIALDLAISEHTVKFHVSSIYTKLGAANRTEAVRLGVRRGLVLL